MTTDIKKKFDKMPIEDIEELRTGVNKFKRIVIENLKKAKTSIDEDNRYSDKDKMEIRATLVYLCKMDTQIIPLSTMCSAIGISGTYYNQLKNVHIDEWIEMYKKESQEPEHKEHIKEYNKIAMISRYV